MTDIVVNAAEAKKLLSRDIRGQLMRLITNIGMEFKRRFQRENFQPYTPQASTLRGVMSRTGALKRSTAVITDKANLHVRVVNTAPYAAVQEDGATIRPVKGKFLTIPLPAALTPSGALKGGAKLVRIGTKFGKDGKGRPVYITLDGQPTRLFKNPKTGQRIIQRKRGEKWENLYVLKGHVKLRAKLGWGDLWESMQPEVREKLGLVVQERPIDGGDDDTDTGPVAVTVAG